MIGTLIGPYAIEAKLGEGGMGEVYRATDTRLKRQVAIKVLPPAVTADRDRLARFQREAELLAALNHPNIAGIYGLDETGGTTALVMELVEGEDLSQRIARGAMPLDEALAIARQIADALEAAHEQGIVHRDLKPANIKVRTDGTVKVLDFGLAKALDEPGGAGRAAALTNSPTRLRQGYGGAGPHVRQGYGEAGDSPTITAEGMILGTAAYMSPEQARGKPVDKRADIWAFGVIVFEMLTGKPLFAADSIADTFTAILTKTPDWSRLPAAVRPMVQAALEPDPRRRLRDVGDAFRLVERAAAETPSRPRRIGPLLVMGATTVAAVGLAAAGWWRSTPPAPAEPELRLQLALPPGAQPDFGISLSPDASRVVFVVPKNDGTRAAWIRDLNGAEARPIAGADHLDTAPFFWSPDSRWLGFSSGGTIQKVDVVGGGPPVRVANVGQIGATWNADGTIVYGTNPGSSGAGSIFRIPAAGGTPVQLTNIDASRGEYAHHHPTFLPDGRHFLYLRAARPVDHGGIYVGSIDAAPDQQSTERLLTTTFGPVFFVPSKDDARGFLFFYRDGTLVAQRFDPATLTLSGDPQQVAAPVGAFIDRALFVVSRTGTILYSAAAPAYAMQFVWVDREGNVLRIVGDPGVVNAAVRSPDGRKVAAVNVDIASASEKRELWISDLERGTKSLFWFKSPVMGPPVWSPDSRRLMFPIVDSGPELYERAIDGLQEGRVVFTGNRGEPLVVSSWSPDGRFVLVNRADQTTANDIWAVRVSDGTATPLIRTPAPERDAQISPDGRWMAYSVTDNSRAEVYVTRVTSSSPTLSVGGGPWRVSSGGGTLPRWRADGREIFYAGANSMMAVPVSTDSGFTVGTAVALNGTAVQNTFGRFGFIDASRDGRELLFARPAADAVPREPANVIVNWAPDGSRQSGVR